MTEAICNRPPVFLCLRHGRHRTSEQVDSAAATETANTINQLTSRVGGGQVRVAGYLSETGTVTIAGAPARMTTATNFEGEVIVGVGNYSIPVTATDASGNSGSVTNTRTFTANGLSTILAYDLSGNTIAKSNSAGVMTFGWDGADRCVAITNGSFRTALAYDGASRWTRITEYSNAVVTADRRFIWNGVTLAEERDASNNVVQRFYSDGFWRGGTNYFYVKDHLGSVREVYDANGVLQARFEYDPYGNRTQTYGTLKVDFGFAGLFELSNGMKLAVWRLYDPQTARWLSKDPIKEQGGLNLYAYCGGDPVNRSDDYGLAHGRWNRFREMVEGAMILGPYDAFQAGDVYGSVRRFAVEASAIIAQEVWERNGWARNGRLLNRSREAFEQLERFQNAIRHAAWQAALTQDNGALVAKWVGDLHELGEEYTLDSCADQHNNQVGRWIGKKTQTRDDILRYLRDRKVQELLIKSYSDPRLPHDGRPEIIIPEKPSI